MSYQNIAFDKLNSFWATFLISPLAFFLISDKYSSEKIIDQVRNPLLVISGERDVVIPLKFTKKSTNKQNQKRNSLN
jgi:hypothetical protein